MNDRKRLQRQHEDYWGRCWTVPLGEYLGAEVRSTRPDNDAHDMEFLIQRRDGTVATSWGEMTGTYYDNVEAKWLWDPSPAESQSNSSCDCDALMDSLYFFPDARMGIAALNLVTRKLGKYRELAECRGRGHLLVVLHSPLTTRSTRVLAERLTRALLESRPVADYDPFETVWLGYRLPVTVPDQSEDAEHAFSDGSGGKRRNFLKCIWSGQGP